jgi:outer membrane protein assembly factor BamB
VADDQKPPVNIGPDKNVKWKVAVPSGLSSPIVVGDKLVITAFDDGKLFTIAYDRATGTEAWRTEARQRSRPITRRKASGGFTPVTDGQWIVSYLVVRPGKHDLAGKEPGSSTPTASAR